MAIDTTSPVSRRALIGAGLGAIIATMSNALGQPRIVAAADGDPMLLGRANKATERTSIETSASIALDATTTDDSGIAISAVSPSGDAVHAYSPSGVGVSGGSLLGRGVLAQSSEGTGLLAYSWSGRAGVFEVGQGRKAQLRLVPSSAATHPTYGAKGDLFIDKPGRLWLCRGGKRWTKLA